ncbi:MAG TPA: glycosyltransferase [Gemmatimonadaceae bacterium]|nr:glycosyltransferase [Gemmatimonadaceae bacterium]
MRVLHLDTGREWRGGQRQLFLLAQGMRERGHEPLVIAPPGSPLAERLRSRGLAVATVGMRGAWDLPAARRIRSLLRTWSPEIVHAHDARAHALALAALTGRPAPPLVVTRRAPAKPTQLGIQLGRRVSRYIALSRAVRAALIDGGIDAEEIDVIPPGVTILDGVPPRDWRDECGWPAGTVVCGVVGSLTSDQGGEMLARIAGRLPEPVRARARLVLLGGRGAGHRVIGGIDSFHAGHVGDGTAALSGLDLLWHASSSQGLGTAALDAMALGVPTIAYDLGSVSEIIEHDRSGVLVPPDDPRAFAAAAARFIRDDRRRRILAAGATARAAAFDAGRMVDRIHHVYQSLIPGIDSV